MGSEPVPVAVIEDDPNIADLVDLYLRQAGFRVYQANSGERGLEVIAERTPRLVILDVGLPGDVDGLEVCRRLRATSDIPVILLTARDTEIDRILGLELGADDYVSKPFGVRELLARVKALLRRSEVASASPEVLKSGKIVVDSSRRTVTVSGKPVALTATEFNLLKALAEREGRVISREDLLSLARGDEVAVMDRTVDVHVAALRKKLGKQGDMIETVRGVGYRMKE
jgi:DNA-binding response OmpR family regulator